MSICNSSLYQRPVNYFNIYWFSSLLLGCSLWFIIIHSRFIFFHSHFHNLYHSFFEFLLYLVAVSYFLILYLFHKFNLACDCMEDTPFPPVLYAKFEWFSFPDYGMLSWNGDAFYMVIMLLVNCGNAWWLMTLQGVEADAPELWRSVGITGTVVTAGNSSNAKVSLPVRHTSFVNKSVLWRMLPDPTVSQVDCIYRLLFVIL